MRHRPAGIWWLHPAFVFAAAGVAISIAAYDDSRIHLPDILAHPQVFQSEHALRITLLCVLVFVLGSLCGTRLGSATFRAGRQLRGEEIPWNTVFLLFRISFYLCLAGYALWTALAIERGITLSVVWGILSGEKGAMYEARFRILTDRRRRHDFDSVWLGSDDSCRHHRIRPRVSIDLEEVRHCGFPCRAASAAQQ